MAAFATLAFAQNIPAMATTVRVNSQPDRSTTPPAIASDSATGADLAVTKRTGTLDPALLGAVFKRREIFQPSP